MKKYDSFTMRIGNKAELRRLLRRAVVRLRRERSDGQAVTTGAAVIAALREYTR